LIALYQTVVWEPPFTLHWPANTGRLALIMLIVMSFGVICRYRSDQIASLIRD
jgi:hypothetical protein